MFSSILMSEIRSINNINIIDVRDPEEYMFGTIPDAKKIPMNTVPDQLDLLSKEKTYHIVCQSGSRSHMVCQYLSQQGYDVVNVMGGMGAYRGNLEY